MKTFFTLALCGLAVALAGCSSVDYYEPRPNLGLYKPKLIAYYNTGAYEQALREAVSPARAYLRSRASSREPRLAVVFDIDETLLSNWPYLKKSGFNTTLHGFEVWIGRDVTPPLKPVQALYREAQSLGLTIFLITGRQELMRHSTIADLRAAGYAQWNRLYLRPDKYPFDSIIPYKSGARKSIEAQGYKIILNIGDQWSDLRGGYSERTFKLPNPYYYIP